MAGFEVNTNEHLIRSNLWSTQLKTLLLDDLYALRFVKTIEQFPDGTTINIPSLGQAETFDFAEGQQVKYNKFDTGNFTFSFDQYVGSANSISEKFKRDSFYSDQVIAAFVPRQHRAIMERIETRIFDRMNASQTTGSANQWNSTDHRWIGQGSANTISLKDFAKARYSLKKALVPLTNLVAVVDPSVSYAIETQTNAVNLLSPQPKWGDMVNSGLVTGLNFRFNIFGFDVYESNYLPRLSATETINSVTSTSTTVVNMLFSAAGGDLNPVIGGFRQMPTVYSEFNKDRQETEYLTVCEYGFKVYRPENLICLLTDYNQIS